MTVPIMPGMRMIGCIFAHFESSAAQHMPTTAQSAKSKHLFTIIISERERERERERENTNKQTKKVSHSQ